MSSYIDRLNDIARNIIGPTSAADQVFIMESGSYSQSFVNARPLSIRVQDQATMAQHPLEDGSTITDHLVIAPISIEIPMIFMRGFRDTHAQIKSAYEEGRLFTVQTKTHTYDNMVITAIPHDESTDYWDVILVTLKMEEARFINLEAGALSLVNVLLSRDASTIRRGSQQSSLTPPGQANKVYDIIKLSQKVARFH